jgi:aspartyl-tRNA(Asn)/glutamyl-tRNA(Gln) amidotransferase subunit A
MFHNTPLRLFPEESETIEGVGRALREGRTTCAAVLERCFHQIDLWDAKVNAWVFVDRAGAMRQARALDDELKAGTCRGPLHGIGSLHGIPFGIKDIIDVAGMPTACGFHPWRDRVAVEDAALVTRLREAGAVILGKTVTTPFAWIDPPPTRNPWNLDRTPGGSSSGSAAAVATGMCLGALGTQTGGSIIRPASFCGVAGYKPAHGELPDPGILPFAPSLDHPGPIARTADDLAVIMDVLGWPAPAEPGPSCAGAVKLSISEVTARITEWRGRSIEPPALFRPRGFFDRRAELVMLDAFDRTLAALSAAGAKVVEGPDDGFNFEGLLAEHRLIMAAEAAATHEARFQEHHAEYAPHIRSLVEEGLSIPMTRYARSVLAWRKAGRDLSHALPPETSLVVTPATVGPAPDTSTTGNPCMNSPWSYLGWATVSFPVGLSPDGLPLAVQVAKPDPAIGLLESASWCESVIRRASEAGGLHP